MLSDPPNENVMLYTGLIMLGLAVFGCLFLRYSNGGKGISPACDILSWIAYTRPGLGLNSWLCRQLGLSVIIEATVGELLIVGVYISWLALQFVHYYELYIPVNGSTAISAGKALGRLVSPMILMAHLTAHRYTLFYWISGSPHERLIGYHRV
jgi:hypothetical protein